MARKIEKLLTGLRTGAEFFAMSEKDRDTWTNVTHVLSKMRREKVSLLKASREYGIDPRTVTRLAKSALRKRANGTYAAKATDRLLRVLVIPTEKGLQEVAVANSRDASLLGKYWDAVQDYLATGDASGLRELEGEQIKDANGIQIPLITDTEELDRLGSAGVLSFESLYAQAA
jgi:hypothetical protein